MKTTAGKSGVRNIGNSSNHVILNTKYCALLVCKGYGQIGITTKLPLFLVFAATDTYLIKLSFLISQVNVAGEII